MAGFPPIDQLYYENPSGRLGGWLAFCLKRFEHGRSQINLVPGERSYTQLRCEQFPTLANLERFLRDHHDATYCYRGQTKRRRVTYSGHIAKLAEAFSELSPLAITFECLVPSVFRSALVGETANWEGYSYPTPLGGIAPAVRAIAQSRHEPLRGLLAEFLMQLRFIAVNNLLIGSGADPRGGIGDTVALTNVSQSLARIISLSQHYEFSSCMIDITHDPDVAIWFASHSWGGELVNTTGARGVIYRFKKDAINRALKKELMAETPAQLAIFAAGLLGVVDIRDSGDFGLRPRRQAGGSILGLENSVTFYILDIYHALEVFTFPLETATGNETALTKEDLCPRLDPVTEVFTPEYALNRSAIAAEELAQIAKQLGLSGEDAGVLYRARSSGLI